MLPGRVVVCPVHYTALVVPRVLAAELDLVADAQGIEARRDIDVVGDQERLSRSKLENETLMATAFDIIAEDAHHCTGVLDLDGV